MHVREAGPDDASAVIELFERLYAETKLLLSKGLHRLELTVSTLNPRAISLYEKVGFEREGVKRHSLRIDDRFVDELYMSKLIAGSVLSTGPR